MTETPKCPYCGAEMIRTDDITTACMSSRYTCRECGSAAPQVHELDWAKFPEVSERAREAALRRAEPENRVLTLEEAQQISAENGGTWLEEKTALGLAHITPIDNQTGACYIYTFFAKFPLMAEKYGKTWRCWLRKPTAEEMEREEWEE